MVNRHDGRWIYTRVALHWEILGMFAAVATVIIVGTLIVLGVK